MPSTEIKADEGGNTFKVFLFCAIYLSALNEATTPFVCLVATATATATAAEREQDATIDCRRRNPSPSP
ncbi:hypothetical protein M5D96_004276, partial [Drosophila gunungcola]